MLKSVQGPSQKNFHFLENRQCWETFVTMQCAGHSGYFPRGKSAAIVRRRYPVFFFFFSFLCAVFSCFDTTDCEAYCLTTDGFGIFNVRTNLGTCHTHEGGSDTSKSAEELTRRDRKTLFLTPYPARGSNPRSSDLKSDDSLTTELHPPDQIIL